MNDRTLYLILEINYFKMFGRQITLNPKENSDLLPKEWDLISNYELKSKILSEAIKNNIKIVDTKLYNETINNIEGHKSL